jgi:hypothetical protein
LATKIFKFYGTCDYAKVHTVDKEYGHYGLNLNFDKPSFELYKRTGLRLKVKDKDGNPFVGFRRHPDKVFEGQNPKPEVIDIAGRPIEDLVGNGSKVAVTVSVYDSKMGKGHRLETVQVLELVPYNGGVEDAHAGYDEDGDYVEEPKAAAPPKRQGQAKAPPAGDDELPF